VNNWIAVADLDGWGEETMLLARLVSVQYKDAKPTDFLPGWQWMKKEKHGR
jgi:hypothetical protein